MLEQLLVNGQITLSIITTLCNSFGRVRLRFGLEDLIFQTDVALRTSILFLSEIRFDFASHEFSVCHSCSWVDWWQIRVEFCQNKVGLCIEFSEDFNN